MKFSVVIPLYNKEPYIGFTLQSVLAQSFADFEVLVVDDGSSDAGPHIVASMAQADPRVRLVQQPNGGVSAARNAGIAAARGEWVAFLDADDWWHPEYLATQAAAMAAMPDVEVVATHLRRLPDAKPWLPMPWPAMPQAAAVQRITDLPARWMQGIPFFTSSVAVKRVRLLAMQSCFAVGESQGEDLDLWFRLGEQGDIALTPLPLVAYRTEAAGSLTKAHHSNTLAPYLLRMELRAAEAGAVSARHVAAAGYVAQQRLTLARNALVAGQRMQAWHWLVSARAAAHTRRWQLTALMVVSMPAALVRRWEQWRIARTGSA
jgi:glycosyltransferase involved in cell wall biosynthesis